MLRCIDDKCGFYWERGSFEPYLNKPDGTQLVMEVENYCPYLPDDIGATPSRIPRYTSMVVTTPSVKDEVKVEQKSNTLASAEVPPETPPLQAAQIDIDIALLTPASTDPATVANLAAVEVPVADNLSVIRLYAFPDLSLIPIS